MLKVKRRKRILKMLLAMICMIVTFAFLMSEDTNAKTILSTKTRPVKVVNVTYESITVSPAPSKVNVSGKLKKATSYKVFLYKGNKKVTAKKVKSGKKVTFRNLFYNTKYAIKARAYRGAAKSRYSDSKYVITKNANNPKAKPAKVIVTTFNSFTVRPQQSRVKAGGKLRIADRYEVYVYKDDKIIKTVTIKSGKKKVIKDKAIEQDTLYKLKTRAFYDTKESKVSDEISVRTDKLEEPVLTREEVQTKLKSIAEKNFFTTENDDMYDYAFSFYYPKKMAGETFETINAYFLNNGQGFARMWYETEYPSVVDVNVCYEELDEKDEDHEPVYIDGKRYYLYSGIVYYNLTLKQRKTYADIIDKIVAKVNHPEDPKKTIQHLTGWMGANILYSNGEAGEDNSQYSFAAKKKSKCGGTAYAVVDILNRCGIKTEYISCPAINHADNLIYVDGAWFIIDLTPSSEPFEETLKEYQEMAEIPDFLVDGADVWVQAAIGRMDNFQLASLDILDDEYYADGGAWRKTHELFCAYEEDWENDFHNVYANELEEYMKQFTPEDFADIER